MPVNKKALIRYKALDECFRNPYRKYYFEDLKEAVDKVLEENDLMNISEKTLFNDIKFMESDAGWSIDLKRDFDGGKKPFYRYVDTSFSINNMPLNEMEINQLKTALEILNQFQGMPQFEWMHELLPKLQQGIIYKSEQPIISFDNNEYLKGIEFLGSLYNAVFYEKVLAIQYQPFETEVIQDLLIHPYHLKQYNNRWFLFGYNPDAESPVWNLALDRIVAIKETENKYLKNKIIDWKEYFEDIIGVTKPLEQNEEIVILHFIGKTGKYIETKPLHNSQFSKWIANNTLEVKLKLIINYELERTILSYADSVKVLQPETLRTSISNRLIRAVKQY